MTKEEILALNLQAGERVLMEVEVNSVDTDGRFVNLRVGGIEDPYWVYNSIIHSIRRVEAEQPKTEQAKLRYVTLDEFHNRNQLVRKIYAFQMACEFAERGEEMPDDLRSEIMTYISKSPEIEGIKPEEETEVEGVDYVLDIDGNKMRVGDKCERVKYPEDELEGVFVINEITNKMDITVSGIKGKYAKYFRKVN